MNGSIGKAAEEADMETAAVASERPGGVAGRLRGVLAPVEGRHCMWQWGHYAPMLLAFVGILTPWRPSCGRPVEPGSTLCQPHGERLRSEYGIEPAAPGSEDSGVVGPPHVVGGRARPLRGLSLGWALLCALMLGAVFVQGALQYRFGVLP